MPSTSSKQHRFMEAVKHNPKFAKKVGVPQSVGRDFVAADRGVRKFAQGGALGLANPQPRMQNHMMPGGPELLQGQRPGVPNPRIPLTHPMSPMMGGLRGMLQLADHQIANSGPKLRNMQMRLAEGGAVQDSGQEAMLLALDHLQKGDPQAAILVLQGSPAAMARPEIQSLLASLSGSHEDSLDL